MNIAVFILLALLLCIGWVLVKSRWCEHREDDPADDAYNGDFGA